MVSVARGPRARPGAAAALDRRLTAAAGMEAFLEQAACHARVILAQELLVVLHRSDGDPMLYPAHETQQDLLRPLQHWAMHDMPPRGSRLQRRIHAACAAMRLAEVTHQRPQWRIDSVAGPGNTRWPVREE